MPKPRVRERYCGACGTRVRRPGERDEHAASPPLKLAIVVFDKGARRRFVCKGCRGIGIKCSALIAALLGACKAPTEICVTATCDATPYSGWPRKDGE